MDQDGTPELFVSIGMWEGGFYHIFTCKDGKGVYVGQVYGNSIEKSTGILFNTAGESGYTPNIAYKYSNDGIAEIPDYVEWFIELEVPDYDTDIEVYKPKIKLGDNIYDEFSETDLHFIPIFDNLEQAVTNQEIDNNQ